MLIINADDWGLNQVSTNNSLKCFKNERITSATAMMFMADSERAAVLALESGFDVGLHLNFDKKFDGRLNATKLNEYHSDIASFLKKNKYCQLVYNPFLKNQFDYVYKTQYEEYIRLYKKNPSHIDGHHHMHLCMNMIIDKLIPTGFKVRRNFSFTSTEKSKLNRCYRSIIDKCILKRYNTTDYFFNILPIQRKRILKIFELSKSVNVELSVHPEIKMQYNYLMDEKFMDMIYNAKMASYECI